MTDDRFPDLPPVDVDVEAALVDVTRRGRAARRRRRLVSLGVVAAVLVVGGSVAAAWTNRDDGNDRVRAVPDGADLDLNGLRAGTTTTIETYPVPGEPEPGVPTWWRVDPLDTPDPGDTTVTLLVVTWHCGTPPDEVLRPGVRFEDDRVVVEATRVDVPGCYALSEVPDELDLGQPLGMRSIVDASCLVETCAAKGSGGVQWDPVASVGRAVSPAGPEVGADQAAEAEQVVEGFLDDLQAGRYDEALARWSRVPRDGFPKRLTLEERAPAWQPLFEDPDRTMTVVPSSDPDHPVVLVSSVSSAFVGEPETYRFVMTVGVDGNPMTIDRLATFDRPMRAGGDVWVEEGRSVRGGDSIVLPTVKLADGAVPRVFVDGREVPYTFADGPDTVRFVLPDGPTGPVTVAVVGATVDVPEAVGWTFERV